MKNNRLLSKEKLERPHVPFHINVLLNFEKGSKDFYSVLSYYHYEHPNNENKWSLVLNTRLHNDFWKIAYKICFICLFGVLRCFQHCTGHITTGSWKGRGNQYI